jgi:hypothetical protein
MQINRNDKLIKRNGRIGATLSLVGLGALVLSIYLLFRSMNEPDFALWAWGVVILAFFLTQFSAYFGNRWGRSPRPDELLDSGLKGLDDRYSIYHFNSPVSHLLIGPAGLWILIPYYQKGTITYEKGRWKQRGGGFLQAYMRFFGQEGLGRPDLDIVSETNAIQKFFNKYLPDLPTPTINVALVMTNEQAIINAEDTPTPIVPLKKLKELIRKQAKINSLSSETIQAIQLALPE